MAALQQTAQEREDGRVDGRAAGEDLEPVWCGREGEGDRGRARLTLHGSTPCKALETLMPSSGLKRVQEQQQQIVDAKDAPELGKDEPATPRRRWWCWWRRRCRPKDVSGAGGTLLDIQEELEALRDVWQSLSVHEKLADLKPRSGPPPYRGRYAKCWTSCSPSSRPCPTGSASTKPSSTCRTSSAPTATARRW